MTPEAYNLSRRLQHCQCRAENYVISCEKMRQLLQQGASGIRFMLAVDQMKNDWKRLKSAHALLPSKARMSLAADAAHPSK